ncbi:hypothetical protein BK010_07155 [Tenericutes bacterium MO-XQ]|jgi:transposase-like protein|nr:hypothetical protein BK010_07155 [Tenericutes bacterium MO-XQ]
MAMKGQKFKKVDLNSKLTAVKEHIEDSRTYNYLSIKYDVSENTVKTWVRIYRRDHGLDVKKKGREPKTTKDNIEEKYEILKKYLEYLKEAKQEKK